MNPPSRTTYLYDHDTRPEDARKKRSRGAGQPGHPLAAADRNNNGDPVAGMMISDAPGPGLPRQEFDDQQPRQ